MRSFSTDRDVVSPQGGVLISSDIKTFIKPWSTPVLYMRNTLTSVFDL